MSIWSFVAVFRLMTVRSRRGALKRYIAGFVALENLVDETGGATKQCEEVELIPGKDAVECKSWRAYSWQVGGVSTGGNHPGVDVKIRRVADDKAFDCGFARYAEDDGIIDRILDFKEFDKRDACFPGHPRERPQDQFFLG